MYGARSSHWPWNALAPPIPTGPTMSGPLPDEIWTLSASFAPAYGTASNVRWMFGWLALNFSATACSTSTCSGASPPPRQQYQRIATWPGWAVLPPDVTGVAIAGSDELAAPDAPAADPVDADGVVPLHAETTSAR